MTAEQKTTVARFLDTAGDYLHGGYTRPHAEYAFSDDPENKAPEAVSADDSIDRINAGVAACNACGLCKTRTNVVPGEGVAHPLVLVVGEGPGADEDAAGRPFVGPAGQLLDRMLDSKGKVALSRKKNCFIANVVKCRPPQNRNPENEEMAACAPFLMRQIALLRPKIIFCVGKVSANYLLGHEEPEPIGRLRGNFFSFTCGEEVIPLLPTYHPSALLRNADLKTPAWEDLQKLREKLASLDASYAAEVTGK
jgi:DNA polymerase